MDLLNWTEGEEDDDMMEVEIPLRNRPRFLLPFKRPPRKPCSFSRMVFSTEGSVHEIDISLPARYGSSPTLPSISSYLSDVSSLLSSPFARALVANHLNDVAADTSGVSPPGIEDLWEWAAFVGEGLEGERLEVKREEVLKDLCLKKLDVESNVSSFSTSFFYFCKLTCSLWIGSLLKSYSTSFPPSQSQVSPVNLSKTPSQRRPLNSKLNENTTRTSSSLPRRFTKSLDSQQR